MTQNQNSKDAAEAIRNAANDLSHGFEHLADRLSDVVATAGERLRLMEDRAIDVARDLEKPALRVRRATEDFVEDARKSYARALRAEKRRWYWPFS